MAKVGRQPDSSGDRHPLLMSQPRGAVNMDTRHGIFKDEITGKYHLHFNHGAGVGWEKTKYHMPEMNKKAYLELMAEANFHPDPMLVKWLEDTESLEYQREMQVWEDGGTVLYTADGTRR